MEIKGLQMKSFLYASSSGTKMQEKGLVDFFNEFIENRHIFKNKEALSTTFTPQKILHRGEQIKELARILAPLLRQEKPSNIFLYGKTGTGKTLTARYTSQQMMAVAEERNIPLKVIYINCKIKRTADTEYRLLSYILKEYGKVIPFTGLPTDSVYTKFYQELDAKPHMLLLILDEIDELIKRAGDEFLYNITRVELKKTKVCLVGISNDLNFTDRLDARVRSSMSEEEIVFPPYDANQIFKILADRAQTAFEKEVIEEGMIAKCAAYAAREHGDARKAIDLLRVAGELAERETSKKVTQIHIDQAEEKIEKDKFIDLVENQPLQYKLVLFAILNTPHNKSASTGEIYSIYEQVCKRTNNRPLTQRRVSDIIAEFDMLGVIKATVISKGRYGRTREIDLSIPPLLIAKIKENIMKNLNL